MGRCFNLSRYRDGLLGTVFLLASGSLLLWPRECSQAVVEGLHRCGSVLIPALFPFFILSSLVVELGLSRFLGNLLQPVMGPLFRLGGHCSGALVLGWVGGYPVGARTAISLYQKGQCSKPEAEHLLSFCNNCGPAFALGVVGVGLFGSRSVGLLLYLTHLLSSLLVGLVFRCLLPKTSCSGPTQSPVFQPVSLPLALTRSITGAVQSLLNLSAFVLFFSVVVRCVTLSGLPDALARLLSCFGVSQTLTVPLLTGMLEFSSGVLALSGEGALTGRIAAAAFLMGWGGLSVHCQVLALNDCRLSMAPYLWGKLLHGLTAAALSVLLLRTLPVSVHCFPQPDSIVLSALPIYQISCSGWICLLFLPFLLHRRKKAVEKTGGMVYNGEESRHHRRI